MSTLLFDLTAKSYAKAPIRDQASYEKKLEITRTYLRPDMRVLEIGCGTGSTAIAHAPYVAHIDAYDASGKLLEIAQSRVQEAGVTNIALKKVDVTRVALPDEGYDVVMAHSVLHLLADKEKILARIYRTLKPGGVFVSSTVCLDEMKGGWKLFAQASRILPLTPAIRLFGKDHLRRSMIDAGFRIDHDWAPNDEAVLFLVAKKPEAAAA